MSKRIAIITGATGGIGREFTRLLVEEDIDEVWTVARNEKKLQEFASMIDNLEEVSENREQIEISRYYEKLPKPTLIAAQEYEDGKLVYRNPLKEKENLD